VLNVNTANALCDGTKQVLTYAQQSRERANYEQAALADRMQEYRQQMEQENQRSFSDVDSLATGDGIQAVGRSSHKLIEAVMQSTPRGKVCSTSFSFSLVVV
jgi:Arf-GAP/coiled-coil/ANK repeat/PH domain-containing protein